MSLMNLNGMSGLAAGSDLDLEDRVMATQAIGRAIEARLTELLQAEPMDEVARVFVILDEMFAEVLEKRSAGDSRARGKRMIGSAKTPAAAAAEPDSDVYRADRLQTAQALVAMIRARVNGLVDETDEWEVDRLFIVLDSMLGDLVAAISVQAEAKAVPSAPIRLATPSCGAAMVPGA